MYQVCLVCGEVKSVVISSHGISHSWDDGNLETSSLTRSLDSDVKRVLTCNDCGERHETAIVAEENSFFSRPSTIVIPYALGGTVANIADSIKNIINNLNPYSDINVLSKTEKGKGDCMPAMEYLLSDIDHSHEVFLFPFEFFYRTDEIAVSAQEKIVPVITISYTPVLLFTKEGRFQNFSEFVEEFKGKTIKAGRGQEGSSNYRNYNLRALLGSLGASIEFIDNYPNIESAITGLDNGEIDVYVSFSTRTTEPVLQNKVDALAVFDETDYLITDGKSIRVIPNIVDLGYPEASFDQGYVIVMNKEELESKKMEVIDAINDAILTSTLRTQLGYFLNPAELKGESLTSVIAENRKKANAYIND